jgi:tol-pal system protein YbgF
MTFERILLRSATTFAFVLMSVLGTACWVTADEGQRMEADLVKLKAENAKVRKAAEEEATKSQRERDNLRAEQDAEITKVDAKIQEVNAALEGLRKTASKTGADLADQLADDEKEIARLRGLVEEAQAKTAAIEQQFAAQGSGPAQDLPGRLATLEKKVADDEARLAKFEQHAAQEAAPPLDKEELYKLGKKKLEAQDFDGAREVFTTIVTKYKNDALAGAAQFWIGDSYFQQKNYRKAGLEFQKVCDQFPKSEKAPDAELMVANSFLELNMTADAKSFYQTVIDAYPKSAAAKKAKEKLDELKKKK